MEEKLRQRGKGRRRRPFFEIRSGKQGGGTRERSKFSPSFFPFPPISIERHKGGRDPRLERSEYSPVQRIARRKNSGSRELKVSKVLRYFLH